MPRNVKPNPQKNHPMNESDNLSLLYEALFILLTGAAYLLAKKLYGLHKRPYFHTILLSMIFIIVFLSVCGIEYKFYDTHTRILRFLLDISVVSFGYLLYLNLDFLKKNAGIILAANFLGSLVGVLGVLALGRLLHSSPSITATLLPKSITTPLAVEVSARLGGIVPLTAVIVVLSGLFGAVIAPSVFKLFKLKTPFARGVALGTSSHGIGTARALEYGVLEGAVGGLSIGLMGFFTSLIGSILCKYLI